MYLTQMLYDDLVAAMAIDPLLNPVGPASIKVVLAENNFTPGLAAVYADLGAANNDYGMGPITVPLDTPPIQAYDPLTNEYRLLLPEPLGGFTFTSTSIPLTPKTIYGYGIVTSVGNNLLASALLPGGPLEITAPAQVIELTALVGQFAFLPLGDA
jgi:hypothetical protein